MKKGQKSTTVLVIEDDEDAQKFLSRVLELEGYRVLATASGEAGLETLENENVSLVILDLRLPGRDGWSILQEIRKDEKLGKIPVIVTTAIADSPQRRRTLGMGATEYLVKPMSAQSIARSITRTLYKTKQPKDRGEAGASAATRD